MIYYINDLERQYFEMSTLIPTPPGTNNVTPLETEIMSAFSGRYKVTRNNSEIKLTVIQNGYSEFTNDSAYILLTKK